MRNLMGRPVLIIWIIAGLTACGGGEGSSQAIESTVPSPTATVSATMESFTFSVTEVGESAEQTDGSTMAADEDNQRMMQTSFNNLFERGSFQYDIRLAVLFDQGVQPIEFTLDGTGRFSGLSTSSNIAVFDGTFEGTAVVNDILYLFEADIVSDGVNLYIRVFADNGSGETRRTPWLFFSLNESLDNVLGVTGIDVLDPNAPIPDTLPELPTVEEFFGIGGFGEYIESVRLPDQGNIAQFRRRVDIAGIAGSDVLLEIINLSEDLGGDLDMTDEELAQSINELPQLIELLFPVLDLEFQQYVDTVSLSLDRLTVDLDLTFDPAQANPQAGGTSGIGLNGDLSLAFSNHGGSFDIVVPDTAIPLEEYDVVPLPTPVR